MTSIANLSQLISEYERGENCLTWARAVGLGESKRDQDIISAMVVGDSCQLKDFDENGRNPHEVHLTGRAAANILADRIVMAYYCFLVGRFEDGQGHLEQGRRALVSYVESASLPQGYLEGMLCAFKGTEIYQVIAMAKAGSLELSEQLVSKTLQDVVQLTEKTQFETRTEQELLVGLYIIKYRFICKLTRCRSYQDRIFDALQLVADLEPNNYEWWLLIYKHNERQRVSDKNYVPGRDEKKVLEKAMSLLEKSGKIDFDVDTSFMMFVAGVLRRRYSRGFRLNFGNLTFNSSQEAVEHLKRRVNLMFEMENNFGTPFAEAGHVFCVVLPPEYRDYELATRCCKRALEIRPHSCKGRYNLGKILENQGSTEAAFQYLQLYKADKTKAGALVEAVGVMLWNPLQFEDDLKECFSEVIKNDVFRKNPVHRKRLDFYRGIFYLMLEDDVDGMEQMKRAFDNVPQENIYKYYGPLCWKLRLDEDHKRRIETTIDKYQLQAPLTADLASKIQLFRTLLVVRR